MFEAALQFIAGMELRDEPRAPADPCGRTE